MTEEKPQINFVAWVDKLTRLTARAQATFLNLYIRQMGPALCRSVIKYCYRRLEVINGKSCDNLKWGISNRYTSEELKDMKLYPKLTEEYKRVDIRSTPLFADDEKLN